MAADLHRSIEYFPPARVVVGPDAEAIGYERARARGIEPQVILIRSDGWTLGARAVRALDAYRTWPDLWICFAYLEDRLPGPPHWRLASMTAFERIVGQMAEGRSL